MISLATLIPWIRALIKAAPDIKAAITDAEPVIAAVIKAAPQLVPDIKKIAAALPAIPSQAAHVDQTSADAKANALVTAIFAPERMTSQQERQWFEMATGDRANPYN